MYYMYIVLLYTLNIQYIYTNFSLLSESHFLSNKINHIIEKHVKVKIV